MHELPDEAKKLIAHERTAAGPSQATRERVRRGVMLALASGASASAAHASASATSTTATATPSRWLATASGKLWLGAGLVAMIGAGTLALRGRDPRTTVTVSRPPSAQVTAAAPSQQPLPAVTESAPSASEVRSANGNLQPAAAQPSDVVPLTHAPLRSVSSTRNSQQPVVRHKTVSSSAADHADLRAEMQLLADASSALERGEVEVAGVQLARYRAQFGHGQLKEEERGLDALARCMAREPGAKLNARRYLQRAQAKLLSQRLEAACKETL